MPTGIAGSQKGSVLIRVNGETYDRLIQRKTHPKVSMNDIVKNLLDLADRKVKK